MPLNRENVQLQVYCRAPAPCRDYCGLTVTLTEIILNIWNISHGPHVYPKRIKCNLNEFSIDKRLQWEINRLFGNHVLDYVLSITRNEFNVHYLPTKLFLKILKQLAASDILRLSQTSKIFFELCNTEAVWKVIFQKYVKRSNNADRMIAEDNGWKEALKIKLKFNKNKSYESNNAIKLINKSNKLINQTKNDLRPNVKNTNIFLGINKYK